MSAEQDDHHNDRKMPPQTDTPATAATATATDSTLLSSPFPSKDSSDTTPYPKAASLSTNNQSSVEASQSLQATDIAQVLTSQGPVVKCVLLRAAAAAPTTPDTTNNDTTAVDQNNENTSAGIEELEMDTTPKKQMVQKILGGPWTFLGQYEDEGLMLMIRKEQPSDDEEEEEQPSQAEESSEEQQKPKPDNNNKHGLLLNQHRLQPPFDQAKVWGDILVLKVAATEDDDNDNDTPQADLRVLTNEEFFLDYTKEEYVRFSNRTDVVAPAMVPDETEEDGVEREDNEDSEEDEEEEEEEEEDGDEDSEDEEEDEEESRSAIMNLVMGQVLRKFTEENGRGPDTEELLNIRSIVAQKFGMEMPPPSQEDDDDDNDKEEGQTEEGEHGEPKTTDDDNDTNTISNSAEVAVVEEKCAQTNGENVSKKRNLVVDEDNNTSSDSNNNKRVKFVVETVNDEDEGNTDRN